MIPPLGGPDARRTRTGGDAALAAPLAPLSGDAWRSVAELAAAQQLPIAPVLAAALDGERAGTVELRFPCAGASAPAAPQHRERANVAGEARERAVHAEWYAYLEPTAPNHWLKQVEAARYLELLTPHLPVGQRLDVVDVGGGTGRLALPLARLGHDVLLVEASEAALRDAARAWLGASETLVTLARGSAYDLARIPDAAADLCLVIEVLCYLEEPARALREVVRVVRPGGLVAASVEAWPAGLVADPSLSLDELEAALASRTLYRADDVFVRYYDGAQLAELGAGLGLEAVALVPTHHVLDGLFSGTSADVDLARPAARDRVLAIERRASADPTLAPLGRAWFGLFRKPG